MVLTGKRALDYSGSVSAEDNQGIGGYDRIMGLNGQAQYFARDIDEACHILFRHYDHTYIASGRAIPAAGRNHRSHRPGRANVSPRRQRHQQLRARRRHLLGRDQSRTQEAIRYSQSAGGSR